MIWMIPERIKIVDKRFRQDISNVSDLALDDFLEFFELAKEKLDSKYGAKIFVSYWDDCLMFFTKRFETTEEYQKRIHLKETEKLNKLHSLQEKVKQLERELGIVKVADESKSSEGVIDNAKR